MQTVGHGPNVVAEPSELAGAIVDFYHLTDLRRGQKTTLRQIFERVVANTPEPMGKKMYWLRACRHIDAPGEVHP